MRHGFKMGACAIALSLSWTSIAQARGCARPREVSAIQVSAIQQELMDAALGCGAQATAQYNTFQRVFGPELRKSDAVLLRMFKRIYGHRKGDAEYNAYKTRAAANAELRRDRGITDFCRTAHLVFQAALAPDKPSLNDFVAGVQVVEDSPVDSCQIRVAMTFQGVSAAPAIRPTPRPALPGDVPLPVAAATAAPPAPVTTMPPPRVQ